jgi:hypothetical protein
VIGKHTVAVDELEAFDPSPNIVLLPGAEVNGPNMADRHAVVKR